MKTKDEHSEWIEEFRASIRRPLRKRWQYSFIHTHKPILDEASYRSFNTTRDYRKWCEKNLPSWLGYGQKL